MKGTKFIVPEYSCIWTVSHYHRCGNWVCIEPDHVTTCEFHESQITNGVSELARIEELTKRHSGEYRDEDHPENELKAV